MAIPKAGDIVVMPEVSREERMNVRGIAIARDKIQSSLHDIENKYTKP
jgi:hypothetical protein